jgi:lipopolysaccharide/colanic/teichoic acid biosynthesis glycosyltransferase
MVAIVLATGENADFHGLDEYLPIPLLPLADRPFLQHVIETLVRCGVRRFEFVLSHLPEKIEERLGDGARWGCSFSYHLAPSAVESLRVAARVAAGLADEVLLAHGTCLPSFDIAAVPPDALLVHEGRWTGWARFAAGGRMLLAMTPAAVNGPIPDEAATHTVANFLSIETGGAFLRAQQEALDGSFPDLMISGREADPKVWISRNVALHPSAVITPPVYIGENCRVGKGARIGPSAVIGANCIVDSQSIVVNSMVAPGTYIGEALELDSVIVDRNRLVNLRLGTSFLVSETFLLGSLTSRSHGRTLQRLRDRLIAFAILLLLWPLLLLTFGFLKLTGRGRPADDEVVNVPTEDNPAAWRKSSVIRFETDSAHGGEFLYRFLPGLLSVLAGNVFLVGVQPRNAQEVRALPADWRSIYLKSKAGLITEARVMFGADASADEIYTSEAFYSATESAGHDFKLATLWLRGRFAQGGPAIPRFVDDAKD